MTAVTVATETRVTAPSDSAGCTCRPGRRRRGSFDLVITPESAGWGYSSLRVVTLAPGQSIEFDTGPTR